MPGPYRESVSEQCALLLQEGHEEHADIIAFLQHKRDPYAIPYLKKAIELKPRLKYLEYDDYGAYYKKCLWALQAIGTPKAIAVIEDCTKSGDEVLRAQARYRLSRIHGDES